MNRGSRSGAAVIAILFAVAAFVTLPAAAGSKQTLTGEVSDAMCGKTHMEGSPAECTRSCVAHGSKYALVVGEKVYVLEASDKAVLASLDKQAGKNVTVTGAVNGDNIEVSTVTAAK